MNGIDITVAPHDQAVALLTGIRGEISLVVSRDQSDVTPQPANQGAVTVTWPTTPLDGDTELPIIVQPPTPNYVTVESPSNEKQPPAVVKDATDVAMDSTAAVVDVENVAVADADELAETEAACSVSEPLPRDVDPQAMTSRDYVMTVSDIDVQLETTELMSYDETYDQYEHLQFDVDLDDEGLWAGAVSGVTGLSPLSSDIKDMIERDMLETLRLL